MILLEEVVNKINEKGFEIENVDVTIICQRPKLLNYIPQMRKNLEKVLKISEDSINIKATTTEKLGFEGRQEGISAMAVVLLNN